VDYEVTDTQAVIDWAAVHAPELLTVDLEALAARLMLDDEDLGGVIDMQTGLRVPGVRVRRED
jgi:hypothetical protein